MAQLNYFTDEVSLHLATPTRQTSRCSKLRDAGR